MARTANPSSGKCPPVPLSTAAMHPPWRRRPGWNGKAKALNWKNSGSDGNRHPVHVVPGRPRRQGKLAFPFRDQPGAYGSRNGNGRGGRRLLYGIAPHCGRRAGRLPQRGEKHIAGRHFGSQAQSSQLSFTTLQPIIGVVEFDSFRRCVVADIPGIIEGAHNNRGLGHEFLRHITRCKVLVFVLDMAGSEGRDPIEDLQNLRTEIKLYSEDLAKQPWFVVANKMDLEGAEENLANFRMRFPKVDIIPISALNGDGISRLRNRLDELVGYKFIR